MRNCMNCKFRQTMINNMVGCSYYKKIITNPYEQKACNQNSTLEMFNKIFNKGFAYGQS